MTPDEQELIRAEVRQRFSRCDLGQSQMRELLRICEEYALAAVRRAPEGRRDPRR